MKTKQLILGISILGIFITTLSCNKTNRNNAVEVVQQNNIAEVVFLDLSYLALEVSKGPQYFTTFSGDCSNLSYDTLGMQVFATIEYGNSDCKCNDGKKRKGKIVIAYPIHYDSIGSIFNTALNDYYVNGYSISGSVKAESINNKDVTEVMTATITPENGAGDMTFNSTKTRTFIDYTNSANVIAGYNYSVTGSSSGTTSRGNEYNITITTPLSIQSGCRSVKSGEITVNSTYFKGEATVNYGNGDCDPSAILKYRKKEVKLNL